MVSRFIGCDMIRTKVLRTATMVDDTHPLLIFILKEGGHYDALPLKCCKTFYLLLYKFSGKGLSLIRGDLKEVDA